MTGHSETDRHARMMQALHAFGKSQRKGDPATPPIVSSVKFNLPGDPEAPFVYGRYGTPTLEATEAALGALEGAPVIGFPSGMAAVTAALFFFREVGRSPSAAIGRVLCRARSDRRVP